MGQEMIEPKQTWDILEDALLEITYERDQPPHRGRFGLYRSDETNYGKLFIYTYNPNTYRPDEMRHTQHEFILPVATYNRESWIRWVFDKIAAIELHETCENFKVNGERIYAPHHGNGWDPYAFWPGHDVAEKLKAPGED